MDPTSRVDSGPSGVRPQLRLVAVFVLAASLATCRVDKLITPSTADIRLSVAADTVGIADSVRLTAVVTVDGKPNAAVRVEWSTSNVLLATVDTTGLVHGIGRGSDTITARVENALFLPAPLTASATMRVVVPQLRLAPDSATLTSVGDTVCFRPRPFDARGDSLILAADSLRPDSAFTPAGSAGTSRCFVALRATGPVTVRAWIDTARATSTVRVQPVAATLNVTPDTVRFNSLTAQRSLTASAVDRRGNPITAPTIVWTSRDTTIVRASTAGVVTARGNGATWVHAQSDTVDDSVRVVVQQVAASIAVSPGSDTLETVRGRDTLVATVRDSANQVIGAASPVWTSLAPDSVRVVTYGGTSAILEALAEGSATIVAQDTVGGQLLTATAQITVRYQVLSLQVSPAAATLSAIGDTVRFTATGRDANDSVIPQPRAVWRTADTARVRIDSLTGLATARDSGATNVIARRDAVADTAAATVTPPVLNVDTISFVDSMLRSSPDSVSVIRTVGNVGSGVLGARLTIVHGASWLAVTPDTVNIPASSSTSVRLTARAGSLAEGTYVDTVRVRAGGAAASPQDIRVRFTVYCPLITIAPDTAHAASLAATDCGARHQAGSFADYYQFTGTAGDTLRVALTTSPTSLDTYLYLLNGAGSVVASNDNCPGSGLNSCLQFVVPASGQYTIEATSFNPGAAFSYTLGLTHPVRPGAPTALSQLAEGTPLAVGDSANTSTIDFRVTGQDPNPRDTLRLQVEVRPLGQSFDSTFTATGLAVPNAGGGVTLSATASGLTNFTSYHWQARTCDQTNRCGPWVSFPQPTPNPETSADFTVAITTPVITVTPSEIRDTALFGATAVDTFLVRVLNTGTGTFTWSATESSPWISFSATGSNPGDTLRVFLNPSGLAAGPHTDTVTVTAAGAIGSPAKIVVTFVIEQPVLVVNRDSITRSTNVGSGASFADTLGIFNGGNGSLSWSATHNPANTWLSFAPTSGGAPDSVALTINSSGLAAGVHRDTIVVDAGMATGSPRSIPVTLTVHQPLLAVSPLAIQDSANVADTVDRRRTLYVTNADGGTLTWAASKMTAWVTLSKTSGGGASDSLVVTLHPDTLSGVVHRDTIVFMSPEATNDPIKVPVVFDILQPVLSVTPGTVVDSAVQLQTTPRVHVLTVANTGRGTLAWSATDDTTWIDVSPASAGAPGALTVTLNPSGLAVGTHTGKVIVTSPTATGSPVTIPVTFKITPPPILSVSPSSRADTAFQGSALAKSFVLHIANTGPGSLNWSAVTDTTWLTRSQAGGSAPPTDSTIVTLTPGTLAAGTHNGTVTVTAPGAAGSPATVPVSFVIRPCLEPAVIPDTVISSVVTRSDCAAPQRAGRLAKLYSVQAAAGDTLSLRLTAAFDAYLVLTDSFGTSLIQNDNCPAQSGPACITNFAVPGAGRYVIEATTFAAGDTGTFTLSVVKERAPGQPQQIGQFRGDSTTAIGTGLTTPENVAVFKGTVSDPNPRDSVRFEIEMVLAASPFSGTSTDQSGYVAVGQTAWIRVTGLAENAGYHWQARTCDKTLRCSGWLDYGGNPSTAADFFVNAVLENPSVPTSIGQFRADSTTPIAVGGGSGGSSVVLKGTVSDPDPGDQVRLEVEVQTVPLAGNNFTNAATSASALGASGRVAATTGPATLLLSYHWQVRTCDQTSRCSAWVSFPQPTPNPETSADYGGTLAASPPASTRSARRP